MSSSAHLGALQTQLRSLTAPQTHHEAWKEWLLHAEAQLLICKVGVVVPALWDGCEARVGVERRNAVQRPLGIRRLVLTPAEAERLAGARDVQTCSLLSAEINFSVSGLFSAPAPQDKVSDRPAASEELPTMATPAPATVPAPAPGPASAATKER